MMAWCPPDLDAKMSELLKADLYAIAMRPNPLWDDITFTPLTRWEKFKLWFDAHWPRVHIGPCDHSECW